MYNKLSNDLRELVVQIIEVRNDILKLAYSPFQNGLLLADFLLITEGTRSILAQVIGIESSSEKDINVAILKGCLSVDETGKINSYVGFTPSTGAEISPVNQEQVISMLCEQNVPTVEWGYLAQHDNTLFKTEKSILTNKPLVLMDDYANYNVIASNIVYANKKHGQKTVLVDFDGSLKIDNAFYVTPGEDFKLPLSYETLNYIYDTDLKEESLSTQAVVQDIIIELQEYIKTLKEGFLPFSTIKSVIYSQYEENKIPELMLFKNKFVKYSQQGIFAETAEDFEDLNQSIRENDIVVIDATCVEFTWHKLILNYLAKHITENCSFVAKLEDDNSDKKTVLDIYANEFIYPIVVSNYSHEFVNVMKSIAKNMILFPPIRLVNDFSIYSSFIQKLNRDEYVVCGEDTLYLSFIVRLTYIDSNMAPDYIEEQIQRDVDKLYRAGAKKYQQQSGVDYYSEKVETATQTTNYQEIEEYTTEEDLDFLDSMDAIEQVENQQNCANVTEDDEFNDADLDMLDGMDIPEIDEKTVADAVDVNPQEIQLNYDEANYSIEENDENAQVDVFVEAEESVNLEVVETEEELDEIEQPVERYEIEYIGDSPEDLESEEDAEFADNEIDKLEDEPVEQIEETLEEKADEENSYQSQPIPIYSVPELDNEIELEFSEGNMVYHEKYGRGVIEKIMNYGNKTLCSIQFEEVGRRLLDPNLAGLRQV